MMKWFTSPRPIEGDSGPRYEYPRLEDFESGATGWVVIVSMVTAELSGGQVHPLWAGENRVFKGS
jgi:hypothetical protein